MRVNYLLSITLTLIFFGCANIVAPNGGEKDEKPPSLLDVKVVNKLKDKDKTSILFTFNEFIEIQKWEDCFYISPPEKIRTQKEINLKNLTLNFSESLNKNTTYHISLDECIKDLNEGNILDTLNYTFSLSNKKDTFSLNGILNNSYTLQPIEKAWVMLFKEGVHDSIFFKSTPNYVAKTDRKGRFYFPNLDTFNYTVLALTDFDFIYDQKELIAFNTSLINPKNDSFISLFAFNPIIKEDTISIIDTIVDTHSSDSLLRKDVSYGNLTIITPNKKSCVFLLLQNDSIIKSYQFSNPPFLLTDIYPGEYRLKYIEDTDLNGKWTTGNWERKKQPEKVMNYPSEITIRSNWDLELEWSIY